MIRHSRVQAKEHKSRCSLLHHQFLLTCLSPQGGQETNSCLLTLSLDLIKAGQHCDQCSCLPDSLGPLEPCLSLKPCLTQLFPVPSTIGRTNYLWLKPCRPTCSVDREPFRFSAGRDTRVFRQVNLSMPNILAILTIFAVSARPLSVPPILPSFQ